jgi:hypothetical protein
MRLRWSRIFVSFGVIRGLILSVRAQVTIDATSQGKQHGTHFKTKADPAKKDSLKAAAQAAAQSVMSMYVGNQPGQVPGIFLPADVYYWWLGGATWNVSPPHPSQHFEASY